MSIEAVEYQKLDESVKLLIQKAKQVMRNAYNVYSHFYAGATARTQSGKIFAGANVENASYGLTVCAEPIAIGSAVAAGDPEITELAVIGGADPAGSGGEAVTPCGRCRQIIYEFSQVSRRDIVLYCCNADLSKILRMRISDLLPNSFGPRNLDADLNSFLNRRF